MNSDEQEEQWSCQRDAAWREFCDAADNAAIGDSKVAWAYAKAHPACADELRAFVKGLRAGTIFKTGPYLYQKARR